MTEKDSQALDRAILAGKTALIIVLAAAVALLA